jgi:glycosyltransferase involved in cell wall biosynthesis
MRIAHIVAHASKNGVATSCHSLISAQLRRGHEIILVTPPGSWLGKQKFPPGLKLMESGLATKPREIARVGYQLRSWSPHAFHCHGSRANKYGMAFRLSGGVPIVSTAHSRHVQLPFVFFHQVIAPSIQTANYHRRFNFVPRSKITIIPNLPGSLPDLKLSDSERNARRAGAGFDPADFVIIVVGTVCKRKNQVDALRIIKILSGRFPEVRLLIVGAMADDVPKAEWQSLLADPAVRERVVLTGHRDDSIELIACSDALLSTSVLEEGPVVVTEAMSLGLPVVSYATGQVPELLNAGQSGFAIPIRDVNGAAENLAELIEDQELRARTGRLGKARLAEFCDEDRILDQTETVYRKADSAASRRLYLPLFKPHGVT